MPAITAVVQDSWPPRVLVSVTGLTVGDAIALYRVVGGERTPVRAGVDDAVPDTSFLRTDAELPFGVPVSYVAVVNDDAEYVTAAAATYALPGGKVAVTDAVSGAAAEVVILAWDEKTRARESSLFKVGGRNVVVGGDLGMFESDLELYVDNTAARDSLDATLVGATEGVVQIRQPGGYDGIDSFLAVLAVAERRWSQDGSDPRRVFGLRVAEVEGWAPALEAQGTTLQDIADAYDVTGPNLLPNSYFETDASNWSGLNGASVARSTAQSHQGVASLLVTPNGTTAVPTAQSAEVAVTPSTRYDLNGWIRSAAAGTRTLNIAWYTAAHTLISTSTVSITLAGGSWVVYGPTWFTSPATAAFARVTSYTNGTPPASDTWFLDEATLNTSALNLDDLASDFASLLALAQADFS